MSAIPVETFPAPPRHPLPDPRQARHLQRCLVLAVLLHVWLVLVFGNATGSAAPGQGVWGRLTVKLAGRGGESIDASPGQTAPGLSGADAPSPHAAGTASATPRAAPHDDGRQDDSPDAAPGTATLKLPDGFRPVEQERVGSPPVPQSPAIEPLPAPTPLNRLEARPDTPATPLPSPAELRTADAPRAADVQPLPEHLAAPLQRLEAVPAAPAAQLPRPSELRMPAPPTPAVAPGVELPPPVSRLEPPPNVAVTPLPRAADLRPSTPTAVVTAPDPALPAAVRRLEAPTDPRTATPLPRAAELRSAPAATAAVTDAATAHLPAPVRRLEGAATAERGATPSLPRAADLRPTPPAANDPVTSTDLPAPVRRLDAAEVGTPVSPLQPATGMQVPQPSARSTAMSELSQALPGAVGAPAPAGPAPGGPTADRFAAPGSAGGVADAYPRVGPNVPPPPGAAASTPQAPLNLSLPRGDMASRRGPGLVELLPAPPERKSKLEQSIEDATNKDCRKAYANAGVLAAVPLAIDAVRGKGCKW